MISYVGMGLSLAGIVGSLVLQSVFERQLGVLDAPARDEIQARLGRLWFAVAMIAVAVGLFFALGKSATALYLTVGILLVNASAVALFKVRVLGQVADATARSRLRRTVLAQLTASVTIFAGAAVYLLSPR